MLSQPVIASFDLETFKVHEQSGLLFTSQWKFI